MCFKKQIKKIHTVFLLQLISFFLRLRLFGIILIYAKGPKSHVYCDIVPLQLVQGTERWGCGIFLETLNISLRQREDLSPESSTK